MQLAASIERMRRVGEMTAERKRKYKKIYHGDATAQAGWVRAGPSVTLHTDSSFVGR